MMKMIFAARKRILLLLIVIVLTILILLYNRKLLRISQQHSREQNSQQKISHGTQNYIKAPGAPVIVAVFYEVLCPYSKDFILNGLLPTYKVAAPLMDVKLIPYGKASTSTEPDGSYRFKCQHGQAECEGNIYHACVVEIVSDVMVRVEIVACMIRDNHNPKEAFHKCAKEHNIENIDLIQKCYDSSQGSELLKSNGDITHALKPKLTGVPTITLNGSQDSQTSILINLLSQICRKARDHEKYEKICS